MKKNVGLTKSSKHLLLVIPTVFVLLGTTFAWFYNGDRASTSTIGMDVLDPNYLQIKVTENDTYTTGVKEFEIKEGFTYQEACVSIDDNSLSFYSVNTTGIDSNTKENEGFNSNDAVVTGLKNVTSDLLNYAYYFDFYLKSQITSNLYLSPTSVVSPLSVDEVSSVYGSFSKDYIAGAIRVAILKLNSSTNKYEPCFIWIPNTNIELSLDQDGYHLNRNGNVEESFTFLRKGSINEDYIVSSSGSTTLNNVNIAWGDLKTNELPITIISQGESLFRIVTWVDGYDRETKIPLAGGKIKMSFDFSLEKENEANTNE